MDNYLKKTGLQSLLPHLSQDDKRNFTFVDDAFASQPGNLSPEEVTGLYIYDVPKLGPNGACSTTHEKEDKPYNLTEILHLPFNLEILKSHPETLRLWRLKQVIIKLQEFLGVDWLGIYRRVEKDDKTKVLVKEAYSGRFSRAEFPLTEDFAEQSNNSTVGLSGRAIVVQSIASYSGPYYECDAEVKSEACLPIFARGGDILGIIDAESFTENFFSDEKVGALVKVCSDLGKIGLGLRQSNR